MREKQRSNAIELNLSDMFWQFASNWRKALILAVVCGLILGGWRLVTGIINANDPEYVEMIREKNRTVKENYEIQKRAYESRISKRKEQISRKEEARETSVMLKIDPHNTWYKYVTFYVNTGYQIMPGMDYQNPNYTTAVTNSYIDALNNIDLTEAIRTPEEPNLTAENPVSGSTTKLLMVSEQSGGGMIYVTILGDSRERTDAIFAAAKQLMEERRQILQGVVSEHTLDVLSETDEVTDSDTIRALQSRFYESYTDMITALNEDQAALDVMLAEDPKLTGVGIGSAIKGFIKYGIIGGALGVILGFVIWGMIRCLRGRVNSVEELRSRYDGVMLAAIPRESAKRGKIDKEIFRHLGIRKKLNYRSGIELAAANIRLHLPEEKDVLLIGTVGEDKLGIIGKDLAEQLTDRKVLIGGDVNLSAAAVSAVEEGHTVVCVEGLNESLYQYINHELDTVGKAREQIPYFIVVG